MDRESSDSPGVGQDAPVATPEMDRRTALKKIGALAGAAPAVTLLLTPSASRAWGHGGSPCEGHGNKHCGGGGPGHGGPGGHGHGHGWGHDKGRGKGHDIGKGWGHDRDRGWKSGGGSRKPKGRDL